MLRVKIIFKSGKKWKKVTILEAEDSQETKFRILLAKSLDLMKMAT